MPWFGGAKAEFTEEDLRRRLLLWSETVSSVITATAGEIREQTPDPRLRRRSLLWKVRMIPLSRRAVLNPDPQEGFVGALGLSVAMRQYLSSDGAGANLFGELQPLALEASREIETSARQVGASFLGPDELDRLASQVETLMRQHPIRGEFAPAALVGGLTDPEARVSLRWVIDLPMTPFRALGGVNEGAQAIREFSQVARSFSIIAEDLPRQLRWQSELLAYDLEDRETLLETRAALDSLAESARELTALASTLPEETSAGVLLALEEARAAIADANATLASANELVEPLLRIAGHVEAAGSAWDSAARTIRGGGTEPSEAGERGRPFDILEYQKTAIEVTAAAQELQELVAGIRRLADGPELSPALAEVARTLERAEGGGRALIDHAIWRALLLMIVFFVLLVLYRVLTATHLGKR